MYSINFCFVDISVRCDGVEDCYFADSSDELNCKTLYWGDAKGEYAKEKPPKPADLATDARAKGKKEKKLPNISFV